MAYGPINTYNARVITNDRVSHSGGRAMPPHPTIFLNPPIKTNASHLKIKHPSPPLH